MSVQKSTKNTPTKEVSVVQIWYGENQSLLAFELTYWRDEFRKRHPKASLTDLQFKKGEEAELAREFNQAVWGGGLFAQEKLVIARGFLQADGKSALAEVIKKACGETPAGIYLLFIEGEKVSWSKTLPSDLQKLSADSKITTREFNYLPASEVEKWVMNKAKLLGAVMPPTVARLLISLVGEDYFRLFNEIGKLSAYARGGEIKVPDIDLLVTPILREDTFAFTDAIGRRDYAGALSALKNQLELGSSPQSLVGMLAWHMRVLASVRNHLDVIATKLSARDMAQTLGLHPFVVTKALQQIPYYSRERLAWLYEEMMNLDWKLKTSAQDPEVLFTIFLGKMANEKITNHQ